MKNFTNLVGFSDSKLGYRVAKENLEFVDGKIISKARISNEFWTCSSALETGETDLGLSLTHLKSQMKKNGKKFGAGHLEVISLADLRTRVNSVSTSEKNSFVHMHQAGDVKKHLTDPTNLYQDKRSKFFQDKRSESKKNSRFGKCWESLFVWNQFVCFEFLWPSATLSLGC